MKTIHLQGFLDNFDITDKMEDDYRFGFSFDFGEETPDTLENVFIRMYFSKEQCSLDEAIEDHLHYVFGDIEVVGEETGYSEYTVDGFYVHEAKIGGHDLNEIIKSKGKEYKYVHILIDQVKK